MGILLLTKSIFAIMIGFLSSVVLGLIMIPMLKRMHVGQKISIFVGENHKKKEGTPTMGGLIFILSTFFTTLCLLVTKKIELTNNLIIILLVFLGYALIGFLDDYISLKRGNNEGLTSFQKLFLQLIIALGFFYLYMKNGGQTALIVSTLGIHIEMGWFYGVFLLFVLVGASNAVNLTDGLDGLAGGLSAIAFIAFSLISLMVGFEEIGIFTFILTGSIMGFLIFNTYPAKVFMGDTGSLAIGGAITTIAIISGYPLLIVIVGGIYVVEALSVIIQVTSFKLTGKRVFKMAPIHHHFEQCGWNEVKIVTVFSIITVVLCIIGFFAI